jgi:hypothetical protein
LGYDSKSFFLFDVGGKSIFSSYENGSNKESRNNIHFTYFRLSRRKSAVSLASEPYSSATYKISNLVLPVENSTESYVLGAAVRVV